MARSRRQHAKQATPDKTRRRACDCGQRRHEPSGRDERFRGFAAPAGLCRQTEVATAGVSSSASKRVDKPTRRPAGPSPGWNRKRSIARYALRHARRLRYISLLIRGLQPPGHQGQGERKTPPSCRCAAARTKTAFSGLDGLPPLIAARLDGLHAQPRKKGKCTS